MLLKKAIDFKIWPKWRNFANLDTLLYDYDMLILKKTSYRYKEMIL